MLKKKIQRRQHNNYKTLQSKPYDQQLYVTNISQHILFTSVSENIVIEISLPYNKSENISFLCIDVDFVFLCCQRIFINKTFLTI